MVQRIFVFVVLSIFSLKSLGAGGASLLTEGVLSPDDKALVLASCRKVDDLFGTHRTSDEDFRQKAEINGWVTLLDHDAQQQHLISKGEVLVGEPTPGDIVYADTYGRQFKGIIVESAPYPLGNFGSDEEKLIDEGMIARATADFPIRLHDLGEPTDPSLLDALKKAHPYHGYMFQEPTLTIDGTLDPTQYAATTNSIGSCLSIGVLNKETKKRGVYHTANPQHYLLKFLGLIDDVAEGNLSNVTIMLASGLIRERTLVVLDAINALMQNRLGDAYSPVFLHTFPKLRLTEKWTAYYRSEDEKALDIPYATGFCAGLTVLGDGVHFLRHKDMLGIFPKVSPGTDPDLFSEDGGIGGDPEEYMLAQQRIHERLDTKRPEGISDEEWAHFKKMSLNTVDPVLPSIVDGITIRGMQPEHTPYAYYARGEGQGRSFTLA